MATAYQQAQREGQDVVRTAILDTATHLLVTEGPGALTVRRIAGEAGCSTKVIYTLFGGKDGLVEALWLEGFARFERRLRAAPKSARGERRLHVTSEGEHGEQRLLAASEGERSEGRLLGASEGEGSEGRLLGAPESERGEGLAGAQPLADSLADPRAGSLTDPLPADPLAALRAGLDAYRDYALAEPDYYRVMFQGAVPGFSPGPEAVAAARRSFELLVHAVRACLEQGLLRGGTAREIADLLWMAVHGAVSLEITGFFAAPEAARRYRALYSAVLAPFLLPPDLPDDEPAGEPGGAYRELPYEESVERTAS
ncbi:TetR/AcrR family transcriptional regulator [Nonomuraea sp. LP-02]|uniref:TetR/AcrR family transcriptional regulator n=1 Tax=Nonomuraea sp. LP-02 TaxID=3097960 RepID=UPI002E341980|nr:TetR/AcrR family transcriptional regulator [Nonomuraea sp. LP-02]MED7925320.1 TetR/AcrR family transcriptional regulator [Nonomuraea sp. LP-02]